MSYSDYLRVKKSIDNSSTLNAARKQRSELSEYENIRELVEQAKYGRKEKIRQRNQFREESLKEMLTAALNGIYMSALVESMMLTDHTKILAESMVPRYIEQSGGARAVLSKMRGKTYLLDTICEAVEEAAEKAEEEDKKEKENDKKEEEKKDETDKGKDDKKDTEENKDNPKKDKKEKEEDVDTSDTDTENSSDDIDLGSDDDVSDEDDDLLDDSEDGKEEDTPDVPETDDIPDVEEDPSIDKETLDAKEDMFEKLENEEDVESAVNIIANRISSAEEEFIKKNAEDKQKIEDLVTDMNDRLKAAKKDPNVSEEEEEKIEQESAYRIKRNIADIRDSRPRGIFESFVRTLSSSIVEEQGSEGLKENYYNESGQLDISSVVDSTKCLYGFLEFVNTIQLEKVDERYITKVLEEL